RRMTVSAAVTPSSVRPVSNQGLFAADADGRIEPGDAMEGELAEHAMAASTRVGRRLCEFVRHGQPTSQSRLVQTWRPPSWMKTCLHALRDPVAERWRVDTRSPEPMLRPTRKAGCTTGLVVARLPHGSVIVAISPRRRDPHVHGHQRIDGDGLEARRSSMEL